VLIDAHDAGRVGRQALNERRPDGAFGRHALVFAGGPADRGNRIVAVFANPVEHERAVQWTALAIQVGMTAPTDEETQDTQDHIHVFIPARPAASRTFRRG
jgi:hypothetical protein